MPIRLAVLKDKKNLISMVNHVYFSSEKDFWKEGYYRISEEDFKNYMQMKWLYILEEKQEVLGCVLFKQKKQKTSSFSMLVCHPKHRKKGVGKSLVNYITQKALNDKNEIMQLELLSPKNWVHEEKKFLKEWYTKIGYELKKEVDFSEYHPDHKPFMKCELIFSLYEKKLIN